MRLQSLSTIALLASGVAAHPGHDVQQEAEERRDFLQSIETRSLSHCVKRWQENGLEARHNARRAAIVQDARHKRGLLGSKRKKRDLDGVLNTSHNLTDLRFTPNTDHSTLFASINSCVLTPEVTQGPYYVSGEDIRYRIIEDQEGAEIILDYQVIDVDTCEPVPDVYLEMWHCNSTGVYSGVNAQGNGDSTDLSNIDKTFLRGIQKTDKDGVSQFLSLFPGHYTSRATHIHIMVHTNATEQKNHTLGNENYSSHTGQAFFDQDLISAVEQLPPYNTNTQELTLNADDSILSEEVATEGVDPVMQYTLLGDDVSQGLFAWLAFGINTTLSKEVSPATFRYKEGGVTNSNSGGGGGGGGDGPGGNGTAPSGGPPSGTGVPSGTVIPSSTEAPSSTATTDLNLC
ncbi:unnamed protein product [Clonostachys rhizophaga]|uniref:Intradiol ring-cleavage dioxygenases domain-containing protein n=1 Tax=Clonostachys rhizophaga TaxID=160324 RepID=A0A9N9VMF4_9HYPO|nr:unnamed protein product [Clonostachys rhizophaga]